MSYFLFFYCIPLSKLSYISQPYVGLRHTRGRAAQKPTCLVTTSILLAIDLACEIWTLFACYPSV
jgi:hypothetical protein